MYYQTIEQFCNDWGYSKTLTYIRDIMECFNIIMEHELQIIDGRIIVDDELYNRIRDIEIKKLKGKVTNWSRNKKAKYQFKEIIKISRYKKEIEERELEKQEKLKREMDRLEGKG